MADQVNRKTFPILLPLALKSGRPEYNLIGTMITGLHEAENSLHMFLLESSSKDYDSPIRSLLKNLPKTVEIPREPSTEPTSFEIPRINEHSLALMLAKSYVYALDSVYKCMKQLSNETAGQPQNVEICDALQDFEAHFHPPDRESEITRRNLKNVGDSIRHIDERVIGEAWGRPIPPSGNKITAISSIFGSGDDPARIVYLDSSGDNSTVALSYDSLKVVQTCIQKIIDAYI